MKASASKKSLHWSFKILLWINLLNSLVLLLAYLNTHISPNTTPYLAYLGLLYPILLLINLLLGLMWVFIRKKWALISLITLLIGWNHFRHFYAINFSQITIENPIKVISFNVRIFNLYDLENRENNRNNILAFLKEEQADIMCFQEFYHQENSAEFSTKDTLLKLLDVVDYDEGYTHELSNQRFFGLATFSKYPIVNRGEITFENDANNFCIYSDIKINKDTLRVFNAHLGSIRLQSDDYEFFGDPNGQDYPKTKDAGQQIMKRLKIAFEKRAIQAEKVAWKLKESPFPVILCVDLNDTPVSYAYRQIHQHLNDAFVESGNGIGQTYIGKVPSNRIDYIFHSASVESANFETHDVNYSDHKPVSVQIGLKSD